MKIGVIGYGNLGKAFVDGLVKSGFDQSNIGVTARTQKNINSINEKYPSIVSYTDKKLLVDNSDVIILVVEPKSAHEVLQEINKCNLENKYIVSLMAGVAINVIMYELIAHDNIKIIRAMPNIAIANTNGVIGIAHNYNSNEVEDIINLFSRLGYVINIDESKIETITITAASGLAFVAYLMDAYQKATNELIDDKVMSKNITLRVTENVIDLIKEKDISFKQLIELITTKGGATDAGLKQLSNDLITKSMKDCVLGGYEHTKKLLG